MKWHQKYSTLITEIISILFILLFVYAAVSKLINIERFKVQLSQSPLLTTYSNWVVWFVPLTELIIVLALLIPRYRLIGLYGCLGLMSAFSMYIIAILNFSDYIPCSCGGILDKMGWTEHLVFNIVFVVLAIVGIFLKTNMPSKRDKNIKQYIRT